MFNIIQISAQVSQMRYSTPKVPHLPVPPEIYHLTQEVSHLLWDHTGCFPDL